MPEPEAPIRNDALREHAEQLLARAVGLQSLALEFEVSVASRAEVLVEGAAFYPPLLADIEAATSSVHINQFGFRPGVVGDAFAEVLVAKAAEGVPVRVIVDARGSDPERGAKSFYERLARAGIDIGVVRAMRLRAPSGPLHGGGPTRWNVSGLAHFDHRKMIVVDGRIGWVGGAGIEDHFQDGRFHDLFLRVEGPVAAQLQLVFLASFRWLGGTVPREQLEPLFPPLDGGAEPIGAIVLHNSPSGSHPITKAIARVIESASETLEIANPYATDGAMIRRIEQAAHRGVRVRLFVPAAPNNWASAAAQRSHYGRLLDAGVRILEYPTMLHAKAFVRDGEQVLAGTCNLDAWSLKRFFEIDLLIDSKELAAQFEHRFASPAEVASSPARRLSGIRQRAKGYAFAAISPLL